MIRKVSNFCRRNARAKVEIARQLSNHDVVVVENDSDLLEAGRRSDKVV